MLHTTQHISAHADLVCFLILVRKPFISQMDMHHTGVRPRGGGWGLQPTCLPGHPWDLCKTNKKNEGYPQPSTLRHDHQPSCFHRLPTYS